MYLALCSLLASPIPRCSASWPVRNRRTVVCSTCARLVFLAILHLALCFLPCLQARDAWHHGRYGPGGFFLAWARLGLLVFDDVPQRCAPVGCLRPKMPVVMAGMDHRTVWRFTSAVLGQGYLRARWCAMSGVVVQTVQHTVWRFRSCRSSRSSTLPFDAQWQFPMVQTFQLIIEIPQFVFGGRCPCLQVFHRCSRG